MKKEFASTNTSKATTSDGRHTIPSAYEFVEFKLKNSQGVEYDINSYVVGLDIIEELYSPTIVAKIFVRDNDNFFESGLLSGQEIIKFKIRKYVKEGTPEELSMELVVKEYPDFSKTTESINVQEYSIVAVSPYSYLSRLQQISRSVNGNPVDLIKEVFRRDLAYPNFQESVDTHPCETLFKGVITRRTPLQAVKWLKNKAYDREGTPFFVYSTISDPRIHIRSWSSIVDQQNRLYPADNKPYRIMPYSTHSPGTEAHLQESKSKILSMKSNIKLDKAGRAASGGFGNTMNVIDYANRSIEKRKITPADLSVTLKEVGPLSGSTEDADDEGFSFLRHLGIDTEKFTSLINASNFDLHLPLPSGESGVSKTAPEIYTENLQKDRAYRSNLESVSHEISLYGDFRLNPSKKINVEIPKASDPKYFDETEGVLDVGLSGTYVIGVSIHSFRNGTYTSRLKLIKDTTQRKRRVSPSPVLPSPTTPAPPFARPNPLL